MEPKRKLVSSSECYNEHCTSNILNIFSHIRLTSSMLLSFREVSSLFFYLQYINYFIQVSQQSCVYALFHWLVFNKLISIPKSCSLFLNVILDNKQYYISNNTTSTNLNQLLTDKCSNSYL